MQSSEEYWDLFFDEVDTSLQSLNEQLSLLEKNRSNSNIVKEIFRIVHTVKGMAATIGFNSVTKLCHKMEELFDFYRQKPQAVTQTTLDCQLKALDSLFKIVEYISESGEELSICRTLSDAISKEIEEELKNLLNEKQKLSSTSQPKQKQIQPKQIQQNIIEANAQKRIEVKVKFSEDCVMPGVRAYMTAQVLEKNGELIQSCPDKEHFLDSSSIATEGLTALIKSSKSVEQLQEKLLKISDVVEVEVREQQSERQLAGVFEPALLIHNVINSTISEQEKYSSGSLDQCPAYIQDCLNDFHKLEISQGKLKVFQVDLVLADDVVNPYEQFFNLLTNLNEYLGPVVYSAPNLAELSKLKEEAADVLQTKTVGEQSKQVLHFILLVDGTHKNILDFLSDACELNKVEVKEVRLPALQAQEAEQKAEADLESAKKSAQEEVKDLSFTKSGDVKTAFVRVNMATLESLMNSVGELVINHNRVKLALGENTSNEMRSVVQYLNQVTTKIQQLVMSVRMVPVNQVFSRFPRFIRDISRELKKEVILEVEGEDTEIDRLMVDELNEIFVHLVRNAVDHGIESAMEREIQGKPRAGSIKMQAYSQGNNVFITISDDGRGIDPHNVKKKAVQKGIITQDQADGMDNQELLDLIFTTGFSTAEVVSDLSGRGVGMDVVRSRVSSLGGHILINSAVGEGSSIRLSIPSTISIIQVLLINDRGGLYAIPLSEIKEIVAINTKQEINEVASCEIITLHGETIPIVNLHKYIQGLDEDAQVAFPEQALVVVVKSEERNYGLIVDSLVGQQEIVIKPISNKVNQEGLINGATVFGDGRVAMILNVDQIIKFYLHDQQNKELSWGDLGDGVGNESDDGVFYWASKY
jgi:two-component system, chemotaxis family, sensor kinase CheA